MQGRTVARYLSRNQLIRCNEIFKPFFKVFEDYCTSYVIYKVAIRGMEIKGSAAISLDFSVSDEKGTEKVDSLLYSFKNDDLYFSKKFQFEKGSEKFVLEAVRKLIYDLDTIDWVINKIIVEEGNRWVQGILSEDRDPHTGQVYEGYNLFLTSDKLFSAYCLESSDKALILT